MKDKIIGIAIRLLAVLLIVFPLFMFYEGVTYTNAKQMETDAENYNEGICVECENGHYVFSGIGEIEGDNTNYSYTCDECGHTIITHQLMK